MAARMCSKASTPTRASTANARSRPWPAKRRPWATPSWPWAPPRYRTSTLSQHRPPELAQHETGVPGPVGERGKCLHTPAQSPPEDPILHATPPAHPATPSTRTGLGPWETGSASAFLVQEQLDFAKEMHAILFEKNEVSALPDLNKTLVR